MFPLLYPVTSDLPSGVKTQEVTRLEYKASERTGTVSVSRHIFRVLAEPTIAKQDPSGVIAAEMTLPECPVNLRTTFPLLPSRTGMAVLKTTVTLSPSELIPMVLTGSPIPFRIVVTVPS
jgi:hypothetical protein